MKQSMVLTALVVLSGCIGEPAPEQGADLSAASASPGAAVAGPLPVAPPNVPPLTDSVVFRLSVDRSDSLHPIVRGETNLPDGTEIMGTLVSDSDISGQDKSVVSGGRFALGPFGPTAGLAFGWYVASVTMPISRVQPDSVKAVIGDAGEQLKGSAVQHGQLGVTVESEIGFVLGDSLAVQLADADQLRLRKRAIELAREMTGFIRNGEAMQPLRAGDGLSGACATRMHTNHQTWNAWNTAVDSLPDWVQMGFALTRGSLKLCTSCIRNAGEYCELAKTGIPEAKEAVERYQRYRAGR